MSTHTITVQVPVPKLRDRDLEVVDHAVALLQALPGVSVEGWGDEPDIVTDLTAAEKPTGLTINHEPIAATEFAYDGCHKIYLIFTDEDRQTMIDNGYDPATDFFPVSELKRIWDQTCFLRFISYADLSDGPGTVPQAYEVEPVIEYTAPAGETP